MDELGRSCDDGISDPKGTRFGWMAAILSALVVVCLISGCAATTATEQGALGPNSAATRSAKALLFKLNHGDLTKTIPPLPCVLVSSGSIGTLEAPYKVCATSTAEGHFVTFLAVRRSPVQGIAYTDRGSETFLDQCYLHLVGKWYAFQAANLANPAAPCRSPWHFHGGP